jgi:hypothetical protein
MVTPILPPPADDASLWRYMNFTKFVAMLSTLYFTRGDAFPDKFEGAMGSIRVACVAVFLASEKAWAVSGELVAASGGAGRSVFY